MQFQWNLSLFLFSKYTTKHDHAIVFGVWQKWHWQANSALQRSNTCQPITFLERHCLCYRNCLFQLEKPIYKPVPVGSQSYFIVYHRQLWPPHYNVVLHHLNVYTIHDKCASNIPDSIIKVIAENVAVIFGIYTSLSYNSEYNAKYLW